LIPPIIDISSFIRDIFAAACAAFDELSAPRFIDAIELRRRFLTITFFRLRH
jgi:hypothetical protein